MNRRRGLFFTASVLAVAACGGAVTTSPTITLASSPTTAPAASVTAASQPAATATRSPAPTPIPTLASTTEPASVAPAGAVHIAMGVPDAQPRFTPDKATAKAGTVVIYLENVPGTIGAPDHNMRIGPAIGQVLAATPNIRAKETVTFTVKDLAPGTYLYWCAVLGLDGQTMRPTGWSGR